MISTKHTSDPFLESALYTSIYSTLSRIGAACLYVMRAVFASLKNMWSSPVWPRAHICLLCTADTEAVTRWNDCAPLLGDLRDASRTRWHPVASMQESCITWQWVCNPWGARAWCTRARLLYHAIQVRGWPACDTSGSVVWTLCRGVILCGGFILACIMAYYFDRIACSVEFVTLMSCEKVSIEFLIQPMAVAVTSYLCCIKHFLGHLIKTEINQRSTVVGLDKYTPWRTATGFAPHPLHHKLRYLHDDRAAGEDVLDENTPLVGVPAILDSNPGGFAAKFYFAIVTRETTSNHSGIAVGSGNSPYLVCPLH